MHFLRLRRQWHGLTQGFTVKWLVRSLLAVSLLAPVSGESGWASMWGSISEWIWGEAVEVEDEEFADLGACRLDPNMRYASGWSILHEASRRGSVAAVGNLLACGANPNAIFYPTGTTPLYEAAVWGHINVCAYLVEFGADLDLCEEGWDGIYSTPLFGAIMSSSLGVVRYLLSVGAADGDPTRPYVYLEFAVRQGDFELLELLEAYGYRIGELSDEEKAVITFAAVSTQKKWLMDYVVERGCEMSGIYDKQGYTPLTFAVSRCLVESVRHLLGRGVPINEVDQRGKSASDYVGVCRQGSL